MQTVRTRTTQTGVTLIELLISMMLGVIVLTGVTQTYLSLAQSSVSILSETKLTSQINSIVTMISNEVRRSGYWGNQGANLQPLNNPFNVTDSTALEVHAVNVQVAGNSAAGGDCIVFTYDVDEDGLLDDTEITGFRLMNGVVQKRTSGDIAANARHDICNDAEDTWSNLSDGNTINITTLNFALNGSACLNTREPDNVDNDGANGVDDAAEADCYTNVPVAASGDISVETRQVTLTIAGNLTNDANTRVSMQKDIRVRNDRIVQW